MYFIGLFVMTIGIAVSVKSNLGVSPVSSIPYTMTCVWGIEMGKATILFHIVLVVIQILLLRKKFKPVQLLQILVGIVGHQRKCAHDQQAGHRNADGREGHEAMGEHIAGAFFEKVTEIFHCGATPSYVPVASPTTRPLSR